jgi:RNA polymerase sigma-70 factor, ECF subfamily
MSNPSDREDVEREIRAHCEAGQLEKAATRLLESYGPEIFRFLMSRLRDDDAANDVFSQFTEDVWRGLGGFRWQCSVRAWSYTVARHGASRYIADARRRRAREAPLSRAGPLSAIGHKIRTQTMVAMRTESKNKMAELRDQLPIDDQTLLILRITRKLDWKEIARVMIDPPEGREPSDREIDQGAARLRKRFQGVKEKLRQMAADGGLVAPPNEEDT